MEQQLEREQRRTLLLASLASVMERADEALLPAVYREVGAALHATTTGLGALTLCHSVVQAACYPLNAYVAARHNRAQVMAVGDFLWAAATFHVGISNTFLQIGDFHGLMNLVGFTSHKLVRLRRCPVRRQATNFPILAEIVPERSRTRPNQLSHKGVYALNKSLEAMLSSFAPPVVGILAQRVYGYEPDDKGKSIQLDRQNAESLAKALYMAIAIPFVICASVYSFLYCRYPRDRERARMQLLVESELEQMEMD